MDDDAAVDETVVLSRRARRARAAARGDMPGDEAAGPTDADDAVDERTVVIDRTGLDERTVVMRRTGLDERTVVMRRTAVDESTVVIDRTRRTDAGSDGETTDADAGAAPDVDPATLDTVKAPPRRDVPERAPAIYKPRPAPLVPSRPPAVGGAAATRDTDTVTASVVRRGRRAGLIAIVSVGAACVISVAGLATLGLMILG
ncbi:hypothetical protein ACFWHT_01930 [Microbacterium sp. NPDC058342]|uniref:hypothetical protein n=1 Tax=Microbacterium sp. NPDC058342 TaxID=3346454 RepID=UPI00364F07FB